MQEEQDWGSNSESRVYRQMAFGLTFQQLLLFSVGHAGNEEEKGQEALGVEG